MDLPQTDGLKWFGEGFDGFPKRLPEDCVEYAIHVIDPSLKASSLRDRLRLILSAANRLVKNLLKDYIWQRDAFALELTHDHGRIVFRDFYRKIRPDVQAGASFLNGRTNYGDSVEDEWLIVYILRELSRQFPEAWIKVNDTDGEFLLVEASNALPRWLNPEVASNRVWINSGQLLIIPKSEPPGKDVGSPTIVEATKYLANGPSKLLHVRPVEEEAFYRLRNYPNQIARNLHHALITCPRKLALILHRNPMQISPIIEAFYLRDHISLQPLLGQNKENLFFPPEDLVTARIKMTKVGYAQLKSQHFPIPLAWADSLPTGDEETNSRAETGMKVACGAEMLMADPQNQDKKHVRVMKFMIDDIQSGEEPLPSDFEVAAWGTSADDESWLDIDFRDLENELAGRPEATGQGKWGDKSAQENLQKMVSRFKDFLNDDIDEGMGANFDNMEDDDSNLSDASSLRFSSDGSEDEFTEMVRKMMGMSVGTMRELMEPVLEESEIDRGRKGKAVAKREDKDSIGSRDIDSDEEEGEIRQLTKTMEAELKASGALRLDASPSETKNVSEDLSLEALSNHIGSLEGKDEQEKEVFYDDFSLVKNLLESFKGQAGVPGPGGNLIGLLGMRLPRDEGDVDEEATSLKTP